MLTRHWYIEQSHFEVIQLYQVRPPAPKTGRLYELMLKACLQNQTLMSWFYGELSRALLQVGPLETDNQPPGTLRPSMVSGGTIVSAFEHMQAEGSIFCQVGLGTPISPFPTVIGWEKKSNASCLCTLVST